VAKEKQCIDIGQTTVSLLKRVAGITRVKSELLILACNNAANRGGNAVAPISEISGGRQTFTV